MVWRKLRFDALRGRQRAGQRMVAKFKAKHGDPEKAVLVVGDWGARASGSASARRLHMKHHTPSMGVGTLRLFRRAGYQVGGLLVCLCVLPCVCLVVTIIVVIVRPCAGLPCRGSIHVETLSRLQIRRLHTVSSGMESTGRWAGRVAQGVGPGPLRPLCPAVPAGHQLRAEHPDGRVGGAAWPRSSLVPHCRGGAANDAARRWQQQPRCWRARPRRDVVVCPLPASCSVCPFALDGLVVRSP